MLPALMPLKDGLFHADGHPYVNDHHEDRPYSSRSPNIQPSDQPSPSAFGADANIEELARQRQCDAVLLQVQLEALGIRHRHPIEPTLGKSYPYKPYVKPPRSRSQEKRSHISMQMEHYNSCAWTGKQVEDIVPYNEPTGLGASGLDAPTRPWVSSRDPPALPFGPEEYMKREAEQLEKVERSEAEFWASVRCGGRITDVADQRYLRSPSPKPTARKPKSEEEMIKAWNAITDPLADDCFAELAEAWDSPYIKVKREGFVLLPDVVRPKPLEDEEEYDMLDEF